MRPELSDRIGYGTVDEIPQNLEEASQGILLHDGSLRAIEHVLISFILREGRNTQDIEQIAGFPLSELEKRAEELKKENDETGYGYVTTLVRIGEALEKGRRQLHKQDHVNK